MKRKMYELIVEPGRAPVFWVDDNEKVLRQITDMRAVQSMYDDIEKYHWSVKNGWDIKNRISNTKRLIIPLSSIDAEDFIPFLKSEIPALDEAGKDIEGNFIVAHRRVRNIIHIGLCIYDGITERPVHWLD